MILKLPAGCAPAPCGEDMTNGGPVLLSCSKPVSELPADGFQNNSGFSYCILLAWSYMIITQFSIESTELRLISLWTHKTRHRTLTVRENKERLSNLMAGINNALRSLEVSDLGVIKSFQKNRTDCCNKDLEGPKYKEIVEFHHIFP